MLFFVQKRPLKERSSKKHKTDSYIYLLSKQD